MHGKNNDGRRKPGPLPTRFAPAERAPRGEILSEVRAIQNVAFLKRLYDCVSDMVVILNRERQIVFSNRSFLDFLGVEDERELFGRRPGEALGCKNADLSEGGCGTTEFCRWCGALDAILSSQTGVPETREWRVVQNHAGEALDLRVRATLLTIGNAQFTILAITDTSHEKRREAMERLFFHDVMTTALSIKIHAEILQSKVRSRADKSRKLILDAVDILLEDISAQKDLLAAENNDLPVHLTSIRSLGLLRELRDFHAPSYSLERHRISIWSRSQNVDFQSDERLVLRILGNMLKNAIEASRAGESVTLGCRRVKDRIEFWVHNKGFMPLDVRRQIFQRSFSTKGPGRGLGTYSMKLLGEKYLRAKISFTTSRAKGTTFAASFPLKFPG